MSLRTAAERTLTTTLDSVTSAASTIDLTFKSAHHAVRNMENASKNWADESIRERELLKDEVTKARMLEKAESIYERTKTIRDRMKSDEEYAEFLSDIMKRHHNR